MLINEGENMKDSNNKHSKNTLSASSGSIKSARKKTLKITSVYFLLGCLWIIFSDKLAGIFFLNTSNLVFVNILKGLLFVTLTSLLIYELIYASFIKLIESEQSTKNVNIKLAESNLKYIGLYQDLENKQTLLKSLIDSTEDWIFYKNSDGAYIGCNKAYEDFIGLSESELMNITPYEIMSNKNLSQINTLDIKTITDQKVVKYEQKIQYNDESLIFEMLNTPYCDRNGDVLGIICVGRDITERKRRENDIIYLSYHDTLTGLFNRSYYEENRNSLDTPANLPISIIVCDVDGLKLVNDSFGHIAGDTLLKTTAEILKKGCRPKDIIIRTGGDEFMIILPETTNEEVETILANMYEECQTAKEQVNNDLHFPSISMGCSTKEFESDSLDETTKIAEEYMYRRKLLARKGVHSIFLKYIKTTIYEKSNETQEHCRRMAYLARRIGKTLNFSQQELDKIELAASLHDIGKISIDLSILQKKGKLNAEEWEIMKKHPEVGWRISQAVPELYPISDIVLSHHERWDGLGYPRGLIGNEIPLLARIINIVDSYDAMTQDRTYQKAKTNKEAIDEIKKMSGKQFDPNLTKIFVEQVISDEGIL